MKLNLQNSLPRCCYNICWNLCNIVMQCYLRMFTLDCNNFAEKRGLFYTLPWKNNDFQYTVLKINALQSWTKCLSLKLFGISWDNSYIPYLLLIIKPCFTCGDRKIWSNIKKYQLAPCKRFLLKSIYLWAFSPS